VKRIDVIHHFAHDHVASRNLKFLHCRFEDNVSDCLTQALRAVEVNPFGLGMLCVGLNCQMEC
jgi:hypothetical protein